jgi:hypothetical protein
MTLFCQNGIPEPPPLSSQLDVGNFLREGFILIRRSEQIQSCTRLDNASVLDAYIFFRGDEVQTLAESVALEGRM